jgi:2-amino-4-hydroxy-6-hydroxymethyldihydropteridine diphosphokinase
MGLLHEVEQGFGRVLVAGERDAPRLLDLDLIAYNDEVFEEGDGLVVPHPRMHMRAFVLRPLAEVAPSWRHPVLGLSVSELIERMPEGQQIEISQERAA